MSSYILGLVMEPIEREFGWSRALISISSVIPSTLMILLSPSTGAIIDRFGRRRLALPSLALTGLSIAMISLATQSVLVWCLLWLFYGTVSLGVTATVWTAAVTGTFSAARGMALGAVMCGVAITQIAVPPLAQWLVDGSGWRSAYLWIGLGWSAPCVILAYFFLYDRHDRARDVDAPQAHDARFTTGLTPGGALRSPPLIRIGLSTLVTMFIGTPVSGSKLQISAFLTGQYAGMAHFGKIFGAMTSLVGIGGGLGSVAAGAVFDRFGSYDPLLWAGVAASFICGALLFNLGRPPVWAARPASTT